MNIFDNSPVIGEHLLYKNFHMICGFGNRGLQHSLAAGRGFAEKILHGAYRTIRLRKFDMRRILMHKKINEYY